MSQNEANGKVVSKSASTPFPIKTLTHLVYWPVYLTSLFLIQTTYYTLKYMKRRGTSLIWFVWVLDLARGTRYFVYMKNRNRFMLFLRGTWILTPSDFIPWMTENKEYNTPIETELENPPHFNALKRAVKQRDNYICTCCGAHGGPKGDENVTLDTDYIYPIEQSGKREENMRTLCRQCHEARHGCSLFTE